MGVLHRALSRQRERVEELHQITNEFARDRHSLALWRRPTPADELRPALTPKSGSPADDKEWNG
jgi:hypothetical protein